MKVREVIEELQKMDPELDVILQKDGEGNGYSPCAGASDRCVYRAESTWSGEAHDLDDSADDMCLDEDEWEAYKKKHPQVCVLWPVN